MGGIKTLAEEVFSGPVNDTLSTADNILSGFLGQSSLGDQINR